MEFRRIRGACPPIFLRIFGLKVESMDGKYRFLAEFIRFFDWNTNFLLARDEE